MTGFVGAVGNIHTDSVSPMGQHLQSIGEKESDTYTDESLTIISITHGCLDTVYPINNEETGEKVWISGYTYGDTGSISECDIPLLNGSFSGIIYDSTVQKLLIFTDRIGSRPIYYLENEEGVLFSTHLQSLSNCPSYDPSFDEDYLQTYFALRRVPGIKTPLEDVLQVPPGSVLSIDLETLDCRIQSYWTPEYNICDRSHRSFVKELAALIVKVLSDQLESGQTPGVLLSGGVDSRLIVAGSPVDLESFHLMDWWNDEAQAAKRVADAVDYPLHSLIRGEDYHSELLEQTTQMQEYISCFHQAHASGFEEKIRHECDLILSGIFFDTLFKGYFVPSENYNLKNFNVPIKSPPLFGPVSKMPNCKEEYLSTLPTTPDYCKSDKNIREIVDRELQVDSEGVRYFGVRYPDFKTFIMSSAFYPLTNQRDYYAYSSLFHQFPARAPSIDNRLLDIHLEMPMKYQLRKNTIGKVINELNSELGSILYPSTGLAAKRNHWLNFFKNKVYNRTKDYLGFESTRKTPKPHYSHGSWQDKEELVRTHPFVKEFIVDNENMIRKMEGIDYENVVSMYKHHLNGANHRIDLYKLLTVISMSLTEEIIKNSQ